MSPDAALAVREAARQLLHETHAAMREAVGGLDAEALDWRPAAETNSLAALVAHALEAERFLVASAACRSAGTTTAPRSTPSSTRRWSATSATSSTASRS